MSILIKGMEMPKDCPMCPMSYWTKGNCEFSGCAIVNGKRYARYEDEKYANSYGRPSWCPLIELPPHGRLIEDTVLDNMTMWNTNREYDRGWDSAVQAAKTRIKSAPTIIESEE